jgi:hypothetical protein
MIINNACQVGTNAVADDDVGMHQALRSEYRNGRLLDPKGATVTAFEIKFSHARKGLYKSIVIVH